MTNEEIKIAKLTDWVNSFPSAKQHLPAFIKMRTGPLKDFIDSHLVLFVKPEEWIKNMEACFALDELRCQARKDGEALEKDKKKLDVMRHTLTKLRQDEVKLETEVSEEVGHSRSSGLVNFGWTSAEKRSVLLEEARLQIAQLLSAQIKIINLRAGEGQVAKPLQILPGPIQAGLHDGLKDVKKSLTLSLQIAIRPEFHQKSLNLNQNATESLAKLSSNPDEIRNWCIGDLESDRSIFLSDVDEMKSDEKVSLIQKLVQEWTAVHVRMFSENSGLQRALQDAKFELNQMQQSISSKKLDMESVNEILIREMKTEAKFHHIYDIENGSDSMGMGKNEQEKYVGTKRREKDDEFKFALACSLLKTWPNVKLVYYGGVEKDDSSRQNWTELCDTVNNEMKATLGNILEQ